MFGKYIILPVLLDLVQLPSILIWRLLLFMMHVSREDCKPDLEPDQLKKNYIKAVNDGLLKVFSKMGISTLQSYQGAQIFEIIGLNKYVVDKYFTGATSRIEGMGLDEIASETLAKHLFAFSRKRYSGRATADWWRLSMETERRISFVQSENHSFVAVFNTYE